MEIIQITETIQAIIIHTMITITIHQVLQVTITIIIMIIIKMFQLFLRPSKRQHLKQQLQRKQQREDRIRILQLDHQQNHQLVPLQDLQLDLLQDHQQVLEQPNQDNRDQRVIHRRIQVNITIMLSSMVKKEQEAMITAPTIFH